MHSKTHSVGFEGVFLIFRLKTKNLTTNNMELKCGIKIRYLHKATVLEGFLRSGTSQIENLSEACLRDIANTGMAHSHSHHYKQT